ncbi:MAG: phosphate acyltransferase PlsX [Bacillota bacterium]
MECCIAVDGMGGDRTPSAPALGAATAAAELGIRVLLVGDTHQLEQAYEAAGIRRPGGVELVEASEVIQPDEQPVVAFRRKRDSSLAVGLRLVKEGKAEALVSAGSTGALLVGGALELGRLPGIDRPALCAVMPTVDGKGVVLLDVGASTDLRPHQLVQFAVMGSVYAGAVLGRKDPVVGLLNIGSEPTKGNELARNTYPRLQASGLNFAGNVEARDIFSGNVDVVVCDGFVGNVVLKNTEGVAEAVFTMMKAALSSSIRARLGALLVRPALRSIKAKLDYAEYGGVPLLGLASPCIKCHGSSNARALANGIAYAVKFVRTGAITAMKGALEALVES